MSVIAKQEVSPVGRRSSEYLAQLLSDKKHLQIFPNVFIHVEKILDEGKQPADQILPELLGLVFIRIRSCGSYRRGSEESCKANFKYYGLYLRRFTGDTEQSSGGFVSWA